MKRILINAAALALGVVLTLFVTYLNAQRKPEPQRQQAAGECSDDHFYGLTAGEFMEGVARYGNTHLVKLPNRPYAGDHNRPDARACWYSIDTLKKFICLIEKYSSQMKIEPGRLGIRFYYAVYGKGKTPPGHGGYMDRHTLFMTPTYSVEGVGNVDFDPRYSYNTFLTAKGHPRRIYDYLSMNNDSFPLVLDGISTKLLNSAESDPVAKNQGQLCPPNCPDTTKHQLDRIDAIYSNTGFNN